MDPYIPTLVWLLGAAGCLYIAKARHLRLTVLWTFLIAILGPLAIPLVLLARAGKKANA